MFGRQRKSSSEKAVFSWHDFMANSLSIWAVAVASLWTLCASAAEPPKPAVMMGLLKTNCLGCHNAEKKKGGLSLETRESALKGGEDGPALQPGKADLSRMIRALSDPGDEHMPPKKQLSEKHIALFQAWVESGAQWDAQALNNFGQIAPAAKLGPLPSIALPVYALSLSPDGSKLAIGQGNQVIIRDAKQPNAAPLATLGGIRDVMQSLAWSPDSAKLAAGGYRQILIWDAVTWAQIGACGDPLEGRVTALAFLTDNQTLVIADGAQGQHGLLRWWKFGENQPSVTVEAHKDNILSLAVGHQGKILASGSADFAVKVWDTTTHQERAKLEGHTNHVLALAFNNDDTRLATAGADKELKVWDVATKEQIVQLGRKDSPVTGVCWTPDGVQLIAVTEDGKPKIYTDLVAHTGGQSTETAKERSLPAVEGALYNVTSSSDGKNVFAGADDGVVWQWLNASPAKKLEPTVAVATAVAASDSAEPQVAPASFTRDILPILSKAGCNVGACHAKASGQAGFKLSIFAFDPRSDYRQITRNSRGRRIFPALPEESLLLRKATSLIAHEGGQRFEIDSESARTITRWIREGMPYEVPGEARLTHIEVTPAEKSYTKEEAQQLRVTAYYSDASTRDVTALADYQSNDKGVATVSESGQIQTSTYSGEAVVVTRFMGMVAISQIAIPSDKLLPAERYAHLPIFNEIDRLAIQRWQKMGLLPSDTCSDAEFLRRASLDAIGALPTIEEARAFADNTDPQKREQWIDHLLEQPNWADHWAIRFDDLLRPNPSRVGVKPVLLFDDWLRQSLRQNKHWNDLVRELLTAQGSSHQYGPIAVWRDKREPTDMASFVGQIFLGVRLECAKCHHHPSERWDQSDYYQLAAYFTRMKRKGQGISAPISGEPEYWWFGPGAAAINHPVTNAALNPRPPGDQEKPIAENDDPRASLLDWITSPQNPYFARAIVNRIWSAFLGRGIVDPVDDFRASNPPSNGPLLDWLAQDFIAHHFDLKHLMRTIMRSHLYQLSSLPNETNVADTRNYSRSYRRRLPAEVLLDAVTAVTGEPDSFQGTAPGTHAIQTWNVKLESEFLDAFGRPNSSAECPCERDAKPSVVQALHLMNSAKLQEKLTGKDGKIAAWAASGIPPEQIIEELYLATYSRKPAPDEEAAALKAFHAPGATIQSATEDLAWALLNSAEFVFNH